MKKYALIAVITLFPFLGQSSNLFSPRMLNGAPLSEQEVRTQCLKLDLGENKYDCVSCTVTEIQPLGVVGGQKISVAKYKYFWSKESGLKECGYGTVLLKESQGISKYEPIWGGFGGMVSNEETPKFFKKSKDTSVLLIPLRFSGTGAAQDDGLLAFRNGKWYEIDNQTYRSELKKKIPPDLTIEKGLYPNYNDMTVESGLWKKNDPNASPSGGNFKAKLAIENDKLTIKDYKYEPSTQR